MILQIRNLTGGYAKDHYILQGVNLDLAKGDSVGIIGLNGSGKSSLARALLNILPYREGEILYNGIDITKKSPQELSEMGIALFMQGGRVFDELSVWENLAFVAKKNQDILQLKKYFVTLSRHSKSDLLKMRADKLSGGQRHELALAMVVLKQPQLVILDEPSAGLSPLATTEMYRTLDVLRQNKLSTILIEQNVSRAIDFCSSVKMLKNGKIMYSSEKSPRNGIENQLKSIEKIMFK